MWHTQKDEAYGIHHHGNGIWTIESTNADDLVNLLLKFKEEFQKMKLPEAEITAISQLPESLTRIGKRTYNLFRWVLVTKT
jgi:hypothetical protein